MKKFDVTSIGEVLIDFTYAGVSDKEQTLYERNPGGAPANVAVAVSHLGGKSAFIGKTGNDVFGTFLHDTLESYGVETCGMSISNIQPTTLAFVTLTQGGERNFSFYRNPGADTLLSSDDLDISLLENSRFLHIGSLSLTHEPARAATYAAIKIAKNSGSFISYDPNWRSPLWSDANTGISMMKSLLDFADLVKISDEELKLLFETGNYSAGAEKILAHGAKLVLITLGARGVFYKTAKLEGIIPAPVVSVTDTTGAGDSFLGALLYRLTRTADGTDLFTRNKTELESDIIFAAASAALCVTKRGAIPAMPSLKDVQEFLNCRP